MDEAWRTGNSRKVYTMLRLYSGRLKAAPSTLQEDGRSVANQHCLSVWRRHFQELLNRPPPDGPEFVPPFKPEYAVSSDPPDVEEVRRALAKLRNNKAAGPDDVQPELLKALPDAAERQYTEALRQLWEREQIPDEWRRAIVIPLHKKGCVTDPSNYRGISLLSAQYKLLERIIADRILAERDSSMRDEQAGFRPGRSTTDQILILRRIIETRSRFAQPFHIAFLDFACAFDSPDRSRIYKLLTADGVPDKIVRLIRDMNTDSDAVVRTRAGTSEPFAVATGVRQGSVLGPMLFNYVIDAVLDEAVMEFNGGFKLIPSDRVITDLEYADDIALISNSRDELQQLLNRVDTLGRCFGLRLKPPKCEVVSTEPDSDPITVAGEPLKESDHFCYLGSIITRDGNVRPDITQRLNKARAAFGMLQQCLWSTSISTKMKLRVYATAIRPILLYAAETWQMTQYEQEDLDKAERRFLRKILGVRLANKIPNAEIYDRVKPVITCRLSDYVAERRMRLLGHLLRRPSERLTRLALEHMPDSSWRRKRGGRKNTWPEMLKDDLRKRGFGNRFHGTDANQAWQSNDRWLRAVTLFAEDRPTWDQCVKEATSMPRPPTSGPSLSQVSQDGTGVYPHNSSKTHFIFRHSLLVC
ncbi:reverse transcriptase [Aphelenchoides avenae]|nr:reverse transcriptase [Aphelenchus avenae]